MFRLDDQARVFGVTAVENLFITEYMPHADGDKIKVYLSGLYHSMRQDADFGVREMAAQLNMEQGLVEAALRYWERRRLVERVSDEPPGYVFHHLGQRMLTGQDNMAGDRAFIAFSDAVYAQFGDRRKIRPGDIALAYEWVQDLGLPQEVVLMLLNHSADTRGINFSFKGTQPLAVMMKEEGVTSPDEAEGYLNHSKLTHQGARSVLLQFNQRRLPTEPELALYRKWTHEWGFDEKAVLAACAETVSANNPSFSYLNGILERLKNKGGGTAPARVEHTLKQENEDSAALKQIFQVLGVAQRNVHASIPAYLALRESYSQEMILLAAQSVRARGGMFEDLEPKLMTWKQSGFTSEQQVRAHLKELKNHEPLLLLVFEASGQGGRANEGDLIKIRQWLKDGHSEALILEAAAQARSSRIKIPYMAKILDNWKKNGVTTVDAARAQGVPQGGQGRKVGFQQYDQQTDHGLTPALGVDLLREAREQDGQ